LLEDSRFVREATLDRVRQALGGAARGTQAAPAGAAVTGWIRSFGSWADFGNDGNAAGADRSTTGILVGADATVDDTWRIGVATGYSHTVLSVPARGSTARVDSYHLAIYGGTRFGALGLSAGAAYAWHDVNTSRGIAFPGFADRTRDSYGARTAQVYGEAGYTVNLGPAAVEPFGNVAWVGLHTDRVRETGGSAALRGGSDSQQATFTTLGVRGQAGFDFAGGHRMMLQGMAGWRHTFGDVTPGAALALGGGPGFTVAGAPIARNALVLEAGVDVFLTETISAGVRYDGQIASSVRDHGFRANLTIRF
jgi:outer membrane autotransporter protein